MYATLALGSGAAGSLQDVGGSSRIKNHHAPSAALRFEHCVCKCGKQMKYHHKIALNILPVERFKIHGVIIQ